jgi:hypothetical protein
MALAHTTCVSSICCFRLMSNDVAVAIEIASCVIITWARDGTFRSGYTLNAQRASEEPVCNFFR